MELLTVLFKFDTASDLTVLALQEKCMDPNISIRKCKKNGKLIEHKHEYKTNMNTIINTNQT